MGIASYAAASSPQLGENARRIALPSTLDSIAVTGVGIVARIISAVISGALATTRAVALAFGLFFMLPVSTAIDTITSTIMSLVPANIGNMSFISPARSQPATLTKSQSDVLSTYNKAVTDFKSILSQRRAQINSNQQLPNLPGQALYLARNKMISAYKDFTDAFPSKIGRLNKFGIPPAYFDADNEPLLDEYTNLFNIMEAPPVNAQNSDTPVKDVVDLGTDIGRAKGLDAANAEVVGRISLGFFSPRQTVIKT